MKIATYNMQHDKRGKSNWTKVFDDVGPDILLAQESLAPSEYQMPLLGDNWIENVAWEPVLAVWGSAVYVKGAKPQSVNLTDYRGWVVGVELDSSPWGVPGAARLRAFSLHAPSGKGSYQKVVNGILNRSSSVPVR